jgi:hypothetical protein
MKDQGEGQSTEEIIAKLQEMIAEAAREPPAIDPNVQVYPELYPINDLEVAALRLWFLLFNEVPSHFWNHSINTQVRFSSALFLVAHLKLSQGCAPPPSTMSSPQTNLCFLSWQLLSELDEMKRVKYSWLLQAHEAMLANWKADKARYQSWRQKVDDLVKELAQKGDFEGANWLTQALLRDHNISSLEDFELSFPAGDGTEVTYIRGRPGQRPVATAEALPAASDFAAAVAQLPSLPSSAAPEKAYGASTVGAENRNQPQTPSPPPGRHPPAVPARTAAPVPKTKQRPSKVTKASKRPQVTTRAVSNLSRGKRKETVQPASRKKTTHVSPMRKKPAPVRPSQSGAYQMNPSC